MRRALRWLNVAIAVVTLASGLAVLGSDLLVTGYRDLHRDALWFVVAYCAVQELMRRQARHPRRSTARAALRCRARP